MTRWFLAVGAAMATVAVSGKTIAAKARHFPKTLMLFILLPLDFSVILYKLIDQVSTQKTGKKMKNLFFSFESCCFFSVFQGETRPNGGKRLELYGATVYADYCIGDPVPLREVVEHVVEDSQDEKLVADHPLARDLVYLTLRTHYPCETDVE